MMPPVHSDPSISGKTCITIAFLSLTVFSPFPVRFISSLLGGSVEKTVRKWASCLPWTEREDEEGWSERSLMKHTNGQDTQSDTITTTTKHRTNIRRVCLQFQRRNALGIRDEEVQEELQREFGRLTENKMYKSCPFLTLLFFSHQNISFFSGRKDGDQLLRRMRK